MKKKYKPYKKVSSMRTFEETKADHFFVDGRLMSRKGLEKMEYFRLRKLIKHGHMVTAVEL